MTAQACETIIYANEQNSLASLPLDSYLASKKLKPFKYTNTGCWRGYVGSWKIQDDKLFLIDLTGTNEQGETLRLSSLFPNKAEVFANWFSGELRIPQGKIIKFVHGGFMSIYEKDIFLELKEGVIVGQKVVDNLNPIKNETQFTKQKTGLFQRIKMLLINN